jgi:molecular chaperone GrpE
MTKQETQGGQQALGNAQSDLLDGKQSEEILLDSQIEGENSPQEAAEDATPPTPEQIIAELEARLAENHDQLLRKAADFENFRKRMNIEKQSAIDFANQSLLLDIIPIIDDFERAIQSAEMSEELSGLPAGKAMLDGISMIEKRLVSQLESKWGLKRFNSTGELFDPNIHEAMFMEKSPDVKEPTVQEEFAKGYTLKDRVIRAAKVKVIMPLEE